jgi:RecA/RadA recombinase
MASAQQNDQSILDSVYVWEFRDVTKLRTFMKDDLSRAFGKLPNVKLIVIDSIAGIFRYESNYIQRARDMRELMQELVQLANVHNFAIVCTNHVTTVPGLFGEEIASLGASWESLVTTKLKVEKTDQTLDNNGVAIIRLRTLELIYSPRLPQSKEKFAITASGVVGLEPT